MTQTLILHFSLNIICLGGAVEKNLPDNAGDARDTSSIPGLGWTPGVRNGNPVQYSYLETSVDRGAWQATVHNLAKSQTWLKQLSTHIHQGIHNNLTKSYVYWILLLFFNNLYLYSLIIYVYVVNLENKNENRVTLPQRVWITLFWISLTVITCLGVIYI